MTCGANSPLEFHEFKASYTDLPGRLKPRLVDARNTSSSVESRTTLDAKPTLDDDVVDEAPPGVPRDLGSRAVAKRLVRPVVALIAARHHRARETETRATSRFARARWLVSVVQ